jgi:hypothetical protein
MAIAVNALGPGRVSVDTGASNALEVLGWNEDSIQVQENRKIHEVHSDQNGGTPGIPIELQNLGEEHVVSLNLSNFDWDVWERIQAGYYGATMGTLGTIGGFMSSNGFRMVLETTTFPRNYLFATPLTKTVPMGSKATIIAIQFRCLPAGGVIWDETIV